MPKLSTRPFSAVTQLRHFLPQRAPQPDRRATLRDLYTCGLISIFRRDSFLRVREPLREATPPSKPTAG